MNIDLDALESIARAVETPGPWETRCEGYGEPTRVCHDSEYVIYLGYDLAADLGPQDAEHIAAFDPPTALALIARVRELEAIVDDGGNQAAKYWRLMTAAQADRDRFADALVQTGEDADRYRAAIEAVAAVPNEFEWDVPPTAKHILDRALDEKGGD